MIRDFERRTGVHALARTQHHVVSYAQLRACGVDRWSAQRALASEELFEVVPHVVATCPPADLTLDGWAMSSVLMRRAATASCGLTAVIRYEAWDRGPVVVQATTAGTPGRFVAPDAPGGVIELRRPRRAACDAIRTWRNVPTTSPLRACQELGTSLTPLQVTYVLREFIRRRDFMIEQFEASVAAAGPFHGTPVIREAIDWYHLGSAGTRGPNEDELCRLLVRSTLPPPLVNVRGATGIADLECDFVWIGSRAVVELNDRRHLLPGAAEADEAKRQRLDEAGWRVLFIPGWRVWTDPYGVLDEIRRLLAQAS
jgi:very-short-patch-repair endonuclease